MNESSQRFGWVSSPEQQGDVIADGNVKRPVRRYQLLRKDVADAQLCKNFFRFSYPFGRALFLSLFSFGLGIVVIWDAAFICHRSVTKPANPLFTLAPPSKQVEEDRSWEGRKWGRKEGRTEGRKGGRKGRRKDGRKNGRKDEEKTRDRKCRDQ